jgi:maltooligosyltrehalose trehalohydrolase
MMNPGATYLSNGKTEFVVWAPLKNKMLLHLIDPINKKYEMQKNAAGYFHLTIDAVPNTKYFFVPEGQKDLPDPASQFQPDGVHGPSQVIDHSKFEWSDTTWKGIQFADLILYELHIGTFTHDGTFDAAIRKLDHLVDTGINGIELMPVAQFPGNRNWGYDGVFPFAIQNSYGGPDGLKKFVNACHQKGIAVFIDVVYNHLGPEGNYVGEFGPYFTDHYHTPWGKAFNFDSAWCDGVREYFVYNTEYLFDNFHIDGLRFDAVHFVMDMGAITIWELIHQKISEIGKRTGKLLHTIAESDLNSPKVVKPVESGGLGFSAQWLDDFHHALYVLLHEEGKKFYEDFGKTEQLVKAFKEGFVHSGEFVKFRKKKFGASSAKLSGDKFVVFSDNHDQAGNRATGARLTSLVEFEKIKLAAAATLLSPYVPMLFMGEEYGEKSPFLYFTSHSDPELIKAVQEGRKRDFQHFDWSVTPPDPQDEKTFLQSKLKWNLDYTPNKILQQWYKELIRLRKTYLALQNFNKEDVDANMNEELFSLHRRSVSSQEDLICVFNFSSAKSFRFQFPAGNDCWEKILDSKDNQWIDGQTSFQSKRTMFPSSKEISIPPLNVSVFLMKE